MLGEKFMWTSWLIQRSWILSCTLTETNCTSNTMNLIWKCQYTSCSRQKKFIYRATLSYFKGGALYWVKQLAIIKTTFVKFAYTPSNERFTIVSGTKIVIWTQKCSKKPIFECIFLWDFRLSLTAMDQKYKFGGTIYYDNSYLETLFRYLKVFRRHPVVHDAPEAVRAHSRKAPGHSYKIGRGPNSFWLCQLTGLLFCFSGKLFLPSIFNSVDFWSSMSCNVLDFEVADLNVIKEVGSFFLLRFFRDSHFALQKSADPQSRRFGVQNNCTEMCRTVDVSNSVSRSTLFQGYRGRLLCKTNRIMRDSC